MPSAVTVGRRDDLARLNVPGAIYLAADELAATSSLTASTPHRPTLSEITEMLETVVRRSDEVLAIPRVSICTASIPMMHSGD